MGIAQVDLSEFEQAALRAAVCTALDVAEAAEALKHGAHAVKHDEATTEAARFVSLLEVAYLVASADGFADEECAALADLLEQATGREATADVLETHFRDLEAACSVLGRRERLRRAAADFTDDASRKDALGFAVLVALADGKLAEPEADVLSELCSDLGMAEGVAAAAVTEVVGRLRAALSS
ncbi:MAG: TerB family tellurite resistance protein [Polyangiaceae bacterium]|nr:TerB family tellurite resistance protein [Polyangiaceae bacterium]